MPKRSVESSPEFGHSLKQDMHALLMIDGTGLHVSRALRAPPNMTLLKLSSYAPELNPAGMLWRQLCRHYLSTRLYADGMQPPGVKQSFCRL